MFPWFFLWAPQIHFPWSGAVMQDISPEAFFGWIKPDAGDGAIEREVFDTASYGKQIGILSEIVLSLVDANRVTPADRRHAIEQLQNLYDGVSAIKSSHQTRKVEAVTRLLEQLQQSDPQQVQRIVARYQAAPRMIEAEPGPS